MTGTLATTGNVAAFEYPECADPEFDLQKDGALFVFGYSIPFMGKPIGCANRFDLKLIGYDVVGKYDIAKDKIKGCDLLEFTNEANIDLDNCVFFFKTISHSP